MEKINELKAKEILSKRDINILKTYIYKKNPNLSDKEKNMILDDAVKKIINNDIDSLNDNKKKKIRRDLMKKIFSNDFKSVNKSDVVKTYLKVNGKKDYEELTKWINKNIKGFITKKDLLKVKNIESKVTDLKEYLKRIFFNIDTKKIIIAFSILLFICSPILLKELNIMKTVVKKPVTKVKEAKLEEYISETLHSSVPINFTYKNINKEKLKKFLESRNSILAESKYFNTIIQTAREFNLNPNVLFAITGQEQGFVNKENKYSEKIANNPYNVFGSWVEYNTDIKDSSIIASRTVINLLQKRPKGVNPFKWINRKYAEDKHWWKGVNKIFKHLEKLDTD
ncbi:MAG: hypothetical protein FH751_10350 [Firmicutes bacterium]|nr:hypothetical protein [Bacillota bacterium]